MTDEDSVQTTEEPVETPVVETSTEAEAPETDDLDDFVLTDEDIAAGDTEEQATEEAPASAEPEPEATEDEAEETEEQSEEPEAEPSQPQEDKPDEEAERKRKNDEYAKQRIAEREARRKAQEENLARYLNEVKDDEDEHANRLREVEAYKNYLDRVELNAEKLVVSYQRALADIDLFKTGSSEIKEELNNSIDDFEALYVKKDRNGEIIEVQGDLYQYLQRKADSLQRAMNVGARQQAKAKATTKAKTVAPPAKTPPAPKVDPDLEAFDEVARRGY